jgi:hypothetical protein
MEEIFRFTLGVAYRSVNCPSHEKGRKEAALPIRHRVFFEDQTAAHQLIIVLTPVT